MKSFYITAAGIQLGFIATILLAIWLISLTPSPADEPLFTVATASATTGVLLILLNIATAIFWSTITAEHRATGFRNAGKGSVLYARHRARGNAIALQPVHHWHYVQGIVNYHIGPTPTTGRERRHTVKAVCTLLKACSYTLCETPQQARFALNTPGQTEQFTARQAGPDQPWQLANAQGVIICHGHSRTIANYLERRLTVRINEGIAQLVADRIATSAQPGISAAVQRLAA